MSYDQKKGQESNWEFDSQLQTHLKQVSNDIRLGHVIHHWKDIFEEYNILPSHDPKKLVLRKI
jgi:hypothetical protein